MQPFLARSRRALAFLCVGALANSCGDATAPTNPTPGVQTISPGVVLHGTPGQALTVQGTDFVERSEVWIGGDPQATQYVNSRELRATIAAAHLLTPGERAVQVHNPPPGGGTSLPLWLRVDLDPGWVPALAAVHPEFLTAGVENALLSLAGERFAPEAEVLVNNEVLPSTLLGPTAMTVSVPANMLSVGGQVTIQVRKQNPVAVSETLLVDVRNPAPTITSLSPEQLTATDSARVEISGTGFTIESEVLVEGNAVPSDYVSGSSLQFSLPASALRAAGQLEVTVRNPAPFGGVAAPALLRVVAPRPELTVVPSRGAVAGGPGFTLTVHGQGFVENSAIHWNGVERSTRYMGPTRLSAAIPAADLASPRNVSITVQTPAPGGGTSASVDYAVANLPSATITEFHRVPFEGADLVYSHASGLLYAGGRDGSSPEANTITAIDPVRGALVGSEFVGKRPSRLAIADDGRVLYATLNFESVVRRVDLTPLSAGLQWSLGDVQAGDLAVPPGQPGTVVVALHSYTDIPSLTRVSVFDDGVARPVSAPGNPGAARLEFLESPSRFYGYNNQDTGFEVFVVALDDDGARHVDASGGLISEFETDIVGAAGRLYGTDGSVVDPETFTLVGRILASGPIAVDAETGRAFVYSTGAIRVVDLNTHDVLAVVPLPGIEFDEDIWSNFRLLRWGEDGLAFLAPYELVIVRSPIFGR